ncbi:HEAT repeat domain-containing protein [Streptomyces sp. SID3343]|uniref:HEAT repeat domain-containing protein n=1 Tax=Streptomyces sp. SID3343 TaxID=2690260 RepID=UPI00136FFEB6|nr:HEAT repeat domain-containing protein [Streptomyces sp. SID3343]MYW04611.1 hypothetical protein [Streptomyces sp. SID3343]
MAGRVDRVGPIDSRRRIAALVDAFPAAHPDNRAPLLDWLAALQPIDAPAWTHAERAARPAPQVRVPRPDDLDQPRSTPQRERLLTLLAEAAEPARRTAAARTLLAWPEPDVRRVVLDAYLRGDVVLPEHADLRALSAVAHDLHAHPSVDHDAARERAARLAAFLPGAARNALAPQLVAWWADGGPTTRAAAESALRMVPADALADAIRDRLAGRAWTFLDLITGPKLLRTPELTATVSRLHADGRADLAERLVFADGPLRGPDAAAHDTRALELLRIRAEFATTDGPSRDALIATARTAGPEQIRRALSRLADDHGHDHAVHTLVVDLLTHPAPRVRTHAHRVSRRLFERPEYLAHTESLLDDPRAEIVRSAVRTLSHAAWTPAVPALVRLLGHGDPTLRAAAADGLARIGAPAVPPLRHAAAHARPDRKSRYTELLDRITSPTR